MRFIDISKPSFIEYVQKTNFANYGRLFAAIMRSVNWLMFRSINPGRVVKGPLFHTVMNDV